MKHTKYVALSWEKLYHWMKGFSMHKRLIKVKRRRNRREVRKIASERINILFKQATDIHEVEPTLAQRYVELARKIGMRSKVRLPPEYRWMVCKHCKGFLLPGKTSRTRIQQRREPHIVITCLHCGGYNRIPLTRGNPKNDYEKTAVKD